MEDSFGLLLLKCLYLMLPAYFANMAPVWVRKINFLNYPIDFDRKVRNNPILGNHKTFRGLFFGVLLGIMVAFIQFLLYKNPAFAKISFFDYSSWFLIGFLMGFGALFGDAVKSFFKRRVGIRPGHRFIPFDQIDFVIGAFIFMAPFFTLTLKIFFISMLASFVLDILATHLAFYLGIRHEKW